MAAGILYVVATPIGNLGDFTQRAIETLKSADRILAEDTRQTLKLLSHFGIAGKKLDRLDAHAADRDIARAVETLEKGESIALVTDAGTPSVSDPGDALVKKAIECNVRVVPIPGASAVLAALVASGLAGGSGFRFFGFLPRSHRAPIVATIAGTPEPVILFESPERTAETLTELAAAMPGRAVAVARELTKLHEEIVRGTLSTLEPREWRGEIAIVLGSWEPEARADEISNAAIDERIDKELASGLHSKTIAERLAAWSGRPKREIYERVVARKNNE
ncbi:MAG: 16S rRNA (cytidine(1402)-2'-O)-methyltransferase [Labilithrix sp.]